MSEQNASENRAASPSGPSGDIEMAAKAAEPRLVVKAAESFNYAAWQNAVPLLHKVAIDNGGGPEISSLVVVMKASPGFARQKRWLIDRVGADGTLPLTDIDLEIDPAYLDRLDEAERGLLTFQLIREGNVLHEISHDLRVLARDEWGGMATMAELLPAFVTPNDPALAALLKSAAALLGEAGHGTALDGYQSKDPNRAYLLAASLWSAVAGRSLVYATPPGSFERVGQKTRRVGTVLGDGLATCLDSTLLFASGLEAMGLNSVIVMLQGHCFVGVWLVETSVSCLVVHDCGEVRKAIVAKELVVFETTMVTHQPPVQFPDAVMNATEALSEEKEREFIAAIDIARARMLQIRPLASHAERAESERDDSKTASPALPASPGFEALPMAQAEELPQTPAGRIDRWQRKLLDLSLRNRLLNFRSTKQTVPLLCPDVSRLEDRLAEGARMRLVSLDEANPVAQRDAELHQQRTQKDLEQEFAQRAMDRDEVACRVDFRELGSRLTALYRKVRSDLAEGGSNTLYLAVGFLRWKQKPTDEKSYRAPLLLVPVKLVRKSASSPYDLVNHEDDVRFNATLLQLLKKDFDCDLTSFETDLPMDDSGVDIPAVLERMRRAVREIPGFEVVEEAAIGSFSFAKYLMWKDLVDRVEKLELNRVVRHLIRHPDKAFVSEGAGSMPQPEEIDTRYAPKDLFHPLPADSSQLAAVMAASEGHDLVIVGPPGTGKSQTIANLITQSLAGGKTVLFVAEKTAALDVVHRRLREHGLGDCCVELHSNKAERRRFLDQLGASWENRRKEKRSEWVKINKKLRVRRDQLDAYAEAVHAPDANGWTPYRAMGESVRGRDVVAPRLEWPVTTRHDQAEYTRLKETIGELASTFAAVPAESALPRVRRTEWSMRWEGELLESCHRLKEAAVAFAPPIERFAQAIGLKSNGDFSIEQLDILSRLARGLVKTAADDVAFLFDQNFSEFPKALAELRELRRRHEAAITQSSATYADEEVERIPVDDLDRQWRVANASLWPMSWLGKRKVRKLLQSYASGGEARPESDMAAIRERQAVRLRIPENPLSALANHWRGLETDVEFLEAQLALAKEIRAALLELAGPLGSTEEIFPVVEPALRDVSGDHPLVSAAKDFRRHAKTFAKAWQGYRQTAGATAVSKRSTAVISEAIKQADHVLSHRTLLKMWTAWVAVKQQAEALGLSPFVEALQSGELETKDAVARFELAYARWWLPAAIDKREPLRLFRKFSHEEAIEEFRRLDDAARRAAAPRARGAVFHNLPPSEEVPKKSELGLLRHQLGLKRPSKSIRQVIAGMPETFGKLAPCLLMSPLSIAQYLPVDQDLFDVVIFDEASQITTWDAIGAIARGTQTIIVGDPKQLPPTNFFGRTDSDEDNDDLEDFEKDLESILDEVQASGLPTRQLNWHYRSRHESLIAFSNWNYYGNKLVTFPAAESADRGVVLKHVKEAMYDRGKSRTNRKEAEAIVTDAVERMKRELGKPEEERLTYGVVTFNSQQQSLIEDLFDEAQRRAPELEWYFSDDRIEPTAVKNLENVQGDERDVMMFSITFGFDAAGKFPISFGAINRDGGERRLNVAVTRARQELVVFTSFLPEQLRAERSASRGVHDLKAFLEYAEKGPEAIIARNEGSLGGLESPLEEAVATALTERGWCIDPQVGVSGFRIDLGVVHPDKPGTYLAGVECDGASYHRSAVARDRDKTRQQVLENLGWAIVRVWSTDWSYDPESAIEQLDETLNKLLQHDRAEKAETSDEAPSEPAPSSAVTAPANVDAATKKADAKSVKPEVTPQLVAKQVPQTQAPQNDRRLYPPVNLDDATANQGRFYDEGYSESLRSMALAILETHGPIRDDLLARELARAHGFGRTGNRIKERVFSLLDEVTSTEESVGRFLWPGPAAQESVPFRYPADEGEHRRLDEIPMPELIGLVREHPALAASEDPAQALAREIGLARLARAARERLEEALSSCGIEVA